MHNNVIDFQHLVLSWFERYGRKDLPWQTDPTAYRVWVSEIMLQQTQVKTVIPYYQRFMQSFPNVEMLADSSQDEVLKHWSGLGYYARARNLHRAAHTVVVEYNGQFPDSLEALMQLPGIGRSTAGAIQALALGQRGIILDGNVKRLLSRFFAVEGWPGKSSVAQRLWDIAQHHTPTQKVPEYTQAVMDLGATLCTRNKPRCVDCPLQNGCQAHRAGTPEDYPHRKPKTAKPQRETRFLLLQSDGGEILLSRRPQHGIWGGLWCFPELPAGLTIEAYLSDQTEQPLQAQQLAQIEHQFTHFKLTIQPILVSVKRRPDQVREIAESPQVWYKPGQELPGGCPAPVTTLLQMLEEALHEPYGQLRITEKRG